MENANVKVGDIFSCNWGYDQTNINFYKCVGFTKKFMKYVYIDTQIVDSDGSSQDLVVPGDYVGKKVRRAKLVYYDGRPGFAPNTFAWATKWNGKPLCQTAPGYGH